MKKYRVTFQKNGKINSIVIKSKDISQNILPSNIIKIEHLYNKKSLINKKCRVKSIEISNLFFELNIILQAKIPICDALEILEKSTKNRKVKEILNCMIDALKNGRPIYKSLIKHEKSLGVIVISFLKIAEENGNINDSIYSLSILLKNIEENKKLIKSKLSYPIVLFISLIISLASIFNFVIPQFEYIFAQYNSSLPYATIALLGLKTFVVNYFLYIFLTFILLYFYFYFKLKKSNEFKYKFDKFLITKVPIVGEMIFVNYFHRFFLSLKILLESEYKFQSSIINSSILLNNQYLLDKITSLDKSIQSGESISSSFESTNLFDDLTLRLIVTGEQSNAMYLSVNEIEKIYKQKLDEKIKLFSSLIEPVFIVTIMLLIVWIVLAVFVPMWSIGEVINM